MTANSKTSFEQYSDTEVIQKILKGNTALFEVLIRRNNPFLYKTGMSYGYSHEDTQDLMQETYMNAYLNLSKFEERSSFKTWIIRIMMNNCFQKKQKFSFKNEITSEIVHEKLKPMYSANHNSDADKTIVNAELRHVIEYALQRVPLEYRMVFSLREISGLSTTETAEALMISESNAKVRLNRAKAMLRKEIEKTYTPEEIYEFNLIYCDRVVASVMDKIAALQ